ncbi:hypothetical protein [Mameliella sp.]|uniref:hypothetical protein n=1 Tax=Mameliella sp. TaxID=1924940 RepID=UPI003BAA332B
MTAPSSRSDKTITLCREVAELAQSKAKATGRSTSAHVTQLVISDAVPKACDKGNLSDLSANDLRATIWRLMPSQWAMEPHPGPGIFDDEGNLREPAEIGRPGPFVRLDVGGSLKDCLCVECDKLSQFAADLRDLAAQGGTATLCSAFPDFEGFPDLVARRKGNGIIFRYAGRDEKLSTVSTQYIPVAALALECVALLAQKQKELDNEPH